MPTMHRISCFRDDVIFVVYIYQRYIYRVDKTRGLYATEERKSAVAPEAEEKLAVEDTQKNEQEKPVDKKATAVEDESEL